MTSYRVDVYTIPPPVVPGGWRSLYSKEWTSDRQPRQLSVDFEGWAKDSGATVGLPDAFRVYANPFVIMKKTQQDWLADVLGLAWIGTPFSKMTKAQKKSFIVEWRSFTVHGRCFTDKGGSWSDGRADYIQGINIGAAPMSWEVLLLGGNKVDVLSETKVSKPEKYLEVQGPYRHYEVRTVNINRLPTPETFLLDRAVCHTPTTIKRTGETGVFPQFGGRAVYPFWTKADSVLVWDRLIRYEEWRNK